MKTETTKYFDVVAVNIETKAERILAENKTKENAEAICNMVVMRRGLDEEFYKVVSHV